MAQPGTRSYDYFDRDADIGIIGRGPTPTAAFESAAEASFAVMADPARIRPRCCIRVAFEETDVELALVIWLNRLLAEARARGLILGRSSTEVRAGWAWPGGSHGHLTSSVGSK
jgi:SHS2 domain-containing protein